MSDIKLPSRDDLAKKYGPNELYSAQPSPQKVPVTPVTIKPVTRKKRSFSRRFADAFLGENIVDVKQYVLNVAVIPTLKKLICDIPQLLFFRSVGNSYFGPNTYNLGANPNTMPYNRISTPSSTSSLFTNSQPQQQNYMFDDIIFSSFAEAEAMRTQMVDRISLYGQVTVGEINEMMRQPVNPVDYNWGWRNVSSCEIRQIRGGYLLMLPRCTYLK